LAGFHQVGDTKRTSNGERERKIRNLSKEEEREEDTFEAPCINDHPVRARVPNECPVVVCSVMWHQCPAPKNVVTACSSVLGNVGAIDLHPERSSEQEERLSKATFIFSRLEQGFLL